MEDRLERQVHTVVLVRALRVIAAACSLVAAVTQPLGWRAGGMRKRWKRRGTTRPKRLLRRPARNSNSKHCLWLRGGTIDYIPFTGGSHVVYAKAFFTEVSAACCGAVSFLGRASPVRKSIFCSGRKLDGNWMSK